LIIPRPTSLSLTKFLQIELAYWNQRNPLIFYGIQF
jgi:hypothetical protein